MNSEDDFISFKKEYVPWNKGTKGICKKNSTSFKKGNIPWNKGTKGICKSNITSFKKGNIPHNYRPIGSERIVDGYKVIKIKDPSVWVYKAKYIWELNYGEIPKGHCIIRLDGNKLNDNIENLRIIKRSVLAILNKKFSYILKDKELMATCINLSELIFELNNKTKKQKEKSH